MFCRNIRETLASKGLMLLEWLKKMALLKNEWVNYNLLKSWRHLNLFEYECNLHARVPRIKRDDGKVRLIPTPWEGKVSGFTLLFEALCFNYARPCPFTM